MPILEREISVYPDDLLDAPWSPSPERFWTAVHTKPRQEKSLARELVSSKVPFYLPLVPQDRLIRGRKFRSHLPLFAGYVFLYAEEEERREGLKTGRIVQTLAVDDQERLVRDLQRLKRLIAADAPLTVERRLEPGRRVRVKSGVMKGVEGTVLTRRGQSRLFIAVEFLKQGASMAIEDFLLEPID